MASEIQNLSGQSLGQYELRALLNKGGMGAVYRAVQGSLGREVAVKVLPASLAADEGYIERFKREARTAAALEHPHIVPVYDYGVDNGVSYVVMRLLTGGSLTDRMANRRGGSMPLTEIAALITPVADALDHAHSRGVIHRDIKPSNIMFDDRGTVYVVDFGIAKLTQSNTMLTTEGSFVGTPTFMAPEQWTGGQVTQATDQYALGILAYQLLTGTPPFEGDTPYVYMHRHVNEVPTPPRLRRADVTPAVSWVVERALAKNPADRFPSTGAFAAAFREAITLPYDAVNPHDIPTYGQQVAAPAPYTPAPYGERAAYPAPVPYPPQPPRYPIPPTPTPTPPPYYPPAPPRPAARKPSRLPLYIIAALLISCCGCTTLFVVLPALDSDSEGFLRGIFKTATLQVTADSASNTPDEPTLDANASFTPVNTPTVNVTLAPADTPTPDMTDLFNQGLAAMEAGSFADAEAFFTLVLEVDPANVDALTRRADARAQQGNAAGSLEDYQQALVFAPEALWLHTALGWTYFGMGDFPNAIASFTSAINAGEAAGNPLDLYAARGEIYAASGDLAAAISDFLNASSYDPNNPYVYQRLGDLSYDLSAFADALGYYRLYVNLVGDAPESYVTTRISELEAQGY